MGELFLNLSMYPSANGVIGRTLVVARVQLPPDLQSEKIQAMLSSFFRAIRGHEYVADDVARLIEGVKKLHHWSP